MNSRTTLRRIGIITAAAFGSLGVGVAAFGADILLPGPAIGSANADRDQAHAHAISVPGVVSVSSAGTVDEAVLGEPFAHATSASVANNDLGKTSSEGATSYDALGGALCKGSSPVCVRILERTAFADPNSGNAFANSSVAGVVVSTPGGQTGVVLLPATAGQFEESGCETKHAESALAWVAVQNELTRIGPHEATHTNCPAGDGGLE